VGAARNWFLGREFVDWSDFSSKFKSTFIRGLRTTDRWNLMQKRVQQKGEHLVDFFHEKVRLCRELKLIFEEIKDHILQSLFNRPSTVCIKSYTC